MDLNELLTGTEGIEEGKRDTYELRVNNLPFNFPPPQTWVKALWPCKRPHAQLVWVVATLKHTIGTNKATLVLIPSHGVSHQVKLNDAQIHTWGTKLELTDPSGFKGEFGLMLVPSNEVEFLPSGGEGDHGPK